MKQRLRHPRLTLALSAALALASGAAAALGLGQIEVRSRAGQPLLAEIPVVSSDPAELEQLQARLASPETFVRIGLQPPQGVVADLQFAVALDNAGRTVIRVTTAEPIQQPLLTFLVEVDWGQGRLVREYSALVDAPRTVAAPAQPPIQAPVVAPPNVIERPAVPAPADPGSGVATAPAPGSDGAGEYGPVKRGESLSAIAGRLGLAQGYSLDQAMIALLRANPDAFIGGDINQLRQGAVLRVPAAEELAAVDAAQASDAVRSRMQQWRQARRAAAQVATPIDRAATAPAPRAAPQAGARLEIAPPAANRATRAGTQSGIASGAEGQMLRQELQQTQETLAARDAELAELKGRIAELEKLQADQQKLVALKDSELASVQQRLATAQQAKPAVTTTPAPVATEPAAPNAGAMPWALGGAALLLALLGGWWLRRRASDEPAFRAPAHAPASSSSSDLAAAFPSRAAWGDDADDGVPAAAEPIATPVDYAAHAEPVRETHVVAPEHERIVVAAPNASSAVRPLTPAAESWTPEDSFEPVEAPQPESPRRPVLVEPVEPLIAASVPTPAAGVVDAVPPPPPNERIELAQAYLELGDHESARQLLGEVVITGDHAARQQAARMLRELE